MFVVLFLVCVGLYAYYIFTQIKATPDEWEQAMALQASYQQTQTSATGETVTAQASAQKFEQQVTAEFSKIRPENEQWNTAFTQQQANVWLAERLDKWLKNQKSLKAKMPSQVKKVLVSFTENKAKVMFATEVKGHELILWGDLRPVVVKDELHVKVERLGVGKETATVETASTLLGNVLSAEELKEIEKFKEPIKVPPLPLHDKRKVDPLSIKIKDKMITGTFKTRRK